MKNNNNKAIPAEGWKGLKENIVDDATSGFLVFLIALPLSLGIAKASDFPAIMGLMTAMIGGVLVSFLAGSRLTIKGPAAGLIVIVAGAVEEFGKGDPIAGWHTALGAILVAGVLQMLFGMIRLGSLVDFFPLSTIHGMLAAIGIIIISKQSHILFNLAPVNELGKALSEPLDLILAIPHSIMNADPAVAMIGVLSMLTVVIWPKININWLRKIPAPLVVLTVSIVLAKFLHLDKKYLVHFDQDFIHTIAWNERFDGIQHLGVFIKYVLMFALVGSLESLLTVKAMDVMDPYQRKSNANKDLMAVGFGNILSSIVGGLPMISEVARSSANIHNGAKTRFANFFHGLFMLIFLFFDLRFSDLIPNAALAALLIGVGLKLASPKEFGRMAKIGFEQFLGFTVTIIVTLLTDLLIGIAAGITVKLIVQGLLGAPMARMFSAKIIKNKNHWDVVGAAVFSNWLGIRKQLEQYTRSSELNLDFSRCNLVDHTVMDNLLHLQMEFDQAGGRLNLIGLDSMKSANKNKHIAGALKRPKQERLNKNGEVKYKP